MTRTQIKLRLSDDLHKKIEMAAECNGVSMNAEMTRRLRDSFDTPELVEQIEQMFDRRLGRVAPATAPEGDSERKARRRRGFSSSILTSGLDSAIAGD